MENFGKATRTPAFLTTRNGTRFDLLISGTAGRRTWYQAWMEKCFFPVHPMIRSLVDRVYDYVLKVLVEQGILEERRVRGDRVWGLKPEVVRIEDQVSQFRCAKCGHGTSGATQDAAIWAGMSCLQYACHGQYSEAVQRVDYYGRLYATGDIQRIFAEEHTGLLNRDDREDLERRFKVLPPKKSGPTCGGKWTHLEVA